MACDADIEIVLLLIGESDEVNFTGAQVAQLSTLYGDNSYVLAAAAARSLAAKYASSVTKKSGDVSVNASDKFSHYTALAKDLDRQATLRGLSATSAYAGGISQGDKDTRASDTDRVSPFFTRDLHDNPGNSGTADMW